MIDGFAGIEVPKWSKKDATRLVKRLWHAQKLTDSHVDTIVEKGYGILALPIARQFNGLYQNILTCITDDMRVYFEHISPQQKELLLKMANGEFVFAKEVERELKDLVFQNLVNCCIEKQLNLGYFIEDAYIAAAVKDLIGEIVINQL